MHAQQQLAPEDLVHYLHGHESQPGEGKAGTPRRVDQPHQHQAGHEEGHHNQTQPQLHHTDRHKLLMLTEFSGSEVCSVFDFEHLSG